MTKAPKLNVYGKLLYKVLVLCALITSTEDSELGQRCPFCRCPKIPICHFVIKKQGVERINVVVFMMILPISIR